MRTRRLDIGFPLLAKELIEQAARRRTYVLRTLYAALLFLAAFLLFYSMLDYNSGDPFGVLGRGRQMFQTLIALQFTGIYFFMPAITCGVITLEKERNSLGLLFLTRLGPWTILFEKFLGRLVPMVTFLLLSLPLLAFSYSLGGITENYLWGGLWMLAVTAVQIGSLAVMCSAFFRTTVGSFISSYILGFLLLFGLPIYVALIQGGSPSAQPGFIGQVLAELGMVEERSEAVVFMFFAPYIFYEAAETLPFSRLVLRSVPILFSAVCCLVLARVFIVRRAFLPPRNLLLSLFKALDRFFFSLNNSLTRGVILVQDSVKLPDEEPIAWRETSKRSLGTVRYLFRVFVALEVPVAFLCVLMAGANASTSLDGASVTLFFLWIIAALMISVTSTSLIAGERSRETLDVLLAAPISGREIFQQKFRGVWRLMAVLAVPFLTIFLFEASWKAEFAPYRRPFSVPLYLTCSLLSFLVYLPLTAWLSFVIGLRVRSQARAILGSLAAISVWCVAPLFLLIAIEIVFGPRFGYRGGGGNPWMYVFLLSPASIIPFNEFSEWREFGSMWGPVILNFLMYGGLLVLLRRICLRSADRYLGRLGDR